MEKYFKFPLAGTGHATLTDQ